MAPKFAGNKAEFTEWVKAIATGNKETLQFIELYYFLLNNFTEADTNHDGEIDDGEFKQLIERASWTPKQHGVDVFNPATTTFKEIDTNSDGAISFNEFLKWAHGQVVAKGKSL